MGEASAIDRGARIRGQPSSARMAQSWGASGVDQLGLSTAIAITKLARNWPLVTAVLGIK